MEGRFEDPPCWQCLGRRVVATLVLLLAAPAAAQVDGHVSVMVDVLPDLQEAPGRQSSGELRTRLFLEHRRELGPHVRINVSGYLDALMALRADAGVGVTPGPAARVDAAIVRPADLYVEITAERFDLRVGMSRLVWGRLDEQQPTDVVNPIDLTRFLLEGPAEARLPVGLVRGRLFLPRGSTLEAVLVPVFRRGRFDQLDEASSPFNLARVPGVVMRREEPQFGAAGLQGGARFTATSGRIDWALTGYRGRRAFPVYTLLQTFAPPPEVLATFPRFTMIGGDVETVRGPWGVRGEVAAFVRDEIQSPGLGAGVPGRSVDAGIGVDRRAGSYRAAGHVLWSWNSLNGSDLSLVASADRSFARETRTLRVFALVDPWDATAFGRVIAAISLRDNVWIEGSAGIFAGSAADTIGRLTRRDFLYGRLRVFL